MYIHRPTYTYMHTQLHTCIHVYAHRDSYTYRLFCSKYANCSVPCNGNVSCLSSRLLVNHAMDSSEGAKCQSLALLLSILAEGINV